jgi:hypothetical protein
VFTPMPRHRLRSTGRRADRFLHKIMIWVPNFLLLVPICTVVRSISLNVVVRRSPEQTKVSTFLFFGLVHRSVG